MTTVLVQTPGASISARGGRLIIETKAGTREVPLGHVSELLVIGHARISTAVIADLAGRGVPTHFLSHAAGTPHSVRGSLNGQLEALRGQFAASDEQHLTAARTLIQAKISNCGWVLRRLGHPARLPHADLRSALDAEALRGLEGWAARLYFAALAGLLPDWGFTGRAYRPPPDPVNAALSFAYSLLLGRTLSAVGRSGLHPALGVLHVSHGRRPALALDIMEPFRGPVCDLTVLGLLRSGQLPRQHFAPLEGKHGPEVRLGQTGCALVAQAISHRMQQWNIDAALQAQISAVQQAWAGQPCHCWKPPVRA